MEKETPKCYSCILKLQGNPMVEIGETGAKVHISFFDDIHTTGIRSAKLYQCSECKEVKIY